ncbi:MAG: GatB/YqeY domain-containing protein [Candidatus Eremiobacteraeota bacterium]|nr:GatB/YqeY domain-containing protein [Candidatus Eremiobacteraeota bacterium]
MNLLKHRLTDEMKKAMKAREKIKLSVIRLLLAGIKNEEISKGRELNDDEVISEVQHEIKKRKEAISEFRKGKRSDLVSKEEAEMDILYSYLPPQANDDEIRMVVKGIIDSIPIGERIHLGKIMPQAIAQLKGKADGKRISNCVRELLE